VKKPSAARGCCGGAEGRARASEVFDDAAGVGKDACGCKGGERGRSPERERSVVDQRLGIDRRDLSTGEGGANPFDSAGFERRRGAGRRLSDQLKSAEEGELTKEQFLFLMAIEAFKKANGKMYPTWSDVLEVVRLLGYRKTRPMELKLSSAEDWVEAGDTESNVRSPRWDRHDPRRKFGTEREAA
jgi:hypothetical protein